MNPKSWTREYSLHPLIALYTVSLLSPRSEAPRRTCSLTIASELALYLGQTLRRGGDDGTGQTLPGPLVEDIKSWVLRHQVTGRSFIRGNSDTWGYVL